MAEGSRVRYKADYIWEAPDDGSRHEVIDGELCVSPPPAWRHQRYRSRLMLMVLGPVVYRDGLGEMVPAPKGVVLDEDSGVAPGLLFIRKERVGIIRERGRRGRPDLVVEVLAPSTASRDRGIKMRRYHGSGVPHYRLMEPDAPAIETYQLGEQGYEIHRDIRPREHPALRAVS